MKRKHSLSLLGVLALCFGALTAEAADFAASRQWSKHDQAAVLQHRARKQAAANTPDELFPASQTFGTINGPDGNVWTYTMDYTTDTLEYATYYTAVTWKICDA